MNIESNRSGGVQCIFDQILTILRPFDQLDL